MISFNVILEGLEIGNQVTEVIQIGKEEVRLYVFTRDMILYIAGPKASTKNGQN